MTPPGELFFSIDHLVDKLVAAADRHTLGKLMRVSRSFYDRVSKPLYTTVTIWEDNVDQFMYQVIDTKSRKTHKRGTRKTRKNNKAKAKTANSDSDWTDDDQPTTSPRKTKRELLSHMRVISIGSHLSSACESYAEVLKTYATNVQVFRFVQIPHSSGSCFRFCERRLCPFHFCFRHTHKLVFRNCFWNKLPIPAAWDLDKATKDVVVVLPVYLQRYSGRDGTGPHELAHSLVGQFGTARNIKVIFWPDWDNSIPAVNQIGDINAIDKDEPMFLDVVANVLKSACYGPGACAKPLVTIYGLETVKLCDTTLAYQRSDGPESPVDLKKPPTTLESPIAAKFRKAYPNKDPDDLHSIVRQQVGGQLEVITMFKQGADGSAQGMRILGSCHVQFKTIEEYLGSLSKGNGEISEWD